MLISEQKPMDEILSYLTGEAKVFLVGCRGCADGCQTGGEKQVNEMKQRLEAEGKSVTGTSLIDFVCNDQLARMTLEAHKSKVLDSDSLLVLCCGVGIQAVASIVDKVVHPGCNTISLGGRHAEWRDAERCHECGQCMLEYTGGICPIARCSKAILHGPCGGSVDGKCEVSKDMPCGWQQIIDQLTRIGRLDRLTDIIPPKNWGVSLTGGPPTVPVNK